MVKGTAAERNAKRAARKETKAASEAEATERRKARETEKRRYVTYRAPDGQRCKVDITRNVTALYFKRRSIGEAEVRAALRFEQDMTSAGYSGLRSASFEPAVDGTKMSAGPLGAVNAQGRLFGLRHAIGPDAFALLEAMICGVLGQQVSVRYIHEMGGPEHRVISSEFCGALAAAAEHYEFATRRPSRTAQAIQNIYNAMKEQPHGAGRPAAAAAQTHVDGTSRARRR